MSNFTQYIVAAHRQAKKVKTDGKKKAPSNSDQPPAENVRGLARWLDGAERRDKIFLKGFGHSCVWGSARITTSQGRRLC
jgi:hypothetical protein